MAKKSVFTSLEDILKKSNVKIALLIFFFATVMALMNWVRFVSNDLVLERPGKFGFYLITETTGVYTILFLIPFLFWFFKKFPITRENIALRLPLHILASMIFGISHTLLMYSSRKAIFWLFNLGTYDFGHFLYRITMEYGHQWFTYWFFFGIAVLIKFIKKNQEQKLKTAQLEQQLTKARLQALQMQLNPHFLFNTLNLISSTMYEDVKAADNMIANLSDLLRLTLKNKNDKEYTLEKELDLLRIYLDIMKERFKDKLVIRTDINNETMNAVVPAFILQPLVENSIVYNMESLKKTRIEIISRKGKNRLKLMVIDNGPGISGDMGQIVKNGVGLSNTIERLEKLYENNYHFHIQNITDGGLQVVIDIPFSYSSSEKYDNEKH